jgi:hypothetical protein
MPILRRRVTDTLQDVSTAPTLVLTFALIAGACGDRIRSDHAQYTSPAIGACVPTTDALPSVIGGDGLDESDIWFGQEILSKVVDRV